jgi:hypothetical protein
VKPPSPGPHRRDQRRELADDTPESAAEMGTEPQHLY